MNAPTGFKASRASHRGTGRPPRRPAPEQPAPHPAGTGTPVRLDIRSEWRDTLTAIGSLVTVLIAIAALVYTNRNNADQQRANRHQLILSRQAQITDRFTRAVEQLGDHNVDVRMGGIYALERIMRDSRVDHPTVFEILANFVRVHAPADRARTGRYRTTTVDALAAITVLGRRTIANDRNGDILDLSRTSLPGARLHGAHLARARLFAGSITGADLSDANLRGADLHDTDLRGTDLRGADLGGADLRGTGVTGAMLRCSRVDDGTSLPEGVLRPAGDASLSGTCVRAAGNSARRDPADPLE